MNFQTIVGDPRTGKTTMAALLMRNNAETRPNFRGLWMTGYYEAIDPCMTLVSNHKAHRASTFLRFDNGSSVTFRRYSSHATRGLEPMDLVIMDDYRYTDKSLAMKLIFPVLSSRTLVWIIKDTVTNEQ